MADLPRFLIRYPAMAITMIITAKITIIGIVMLMLDMKSMIVDEEGKGLLAAALWTCETVDIPVVASDVESSVSYRW